MLSLRVERWLPYCCEQLFDLAADVEHYPEFLRRAIAAIPAASHSAYYNHQALGLGPLRIRFGSKTVLHRPERIDVTSDEPPLPPVPARLDLRAAIGPGVQGEPRRRNQLPLAPAPASCRASSLGRDRRNDPRLRSKGPSAMRDRGATDRKCTKEMSRQQTVQSGSVCSERPEFRRFC